jgi:cobalt-zinc-cadmium resistance protein CzcA
MLEAGIAASLLSLGAIDFGLIVDSSVIMVENCARHVALRPDKSWLDTIRDAALEVRKPTMFGELIIMIVFLPVLALTGVEGKALPPDGAHDDLRAGRIAAAVPVAHAGPREPLPSEAPEGVGALARPQGSRALCAGAGSRAAVPDRDPLTGAGALVVLAALLAAGMGGEFLPKLAEGDLVVNVIRLAGVDVDEAGGRQRPPRAAAPRALPR